MELAPSTLDHILAVQLTVAWAGEGRSDPPRLGWWQTDLVDEAGGGDLFARLLPRSHRWAALEATREAARRVDARARSEIGKSDEIYTLFRFGFELDEMLGDRLSDHKRSGEAPAEALRLGITSTFHPSQLDDYLLGLVDGKKVEFQVVPGGRQLRAKMPSAPDLAASMLAAALASTPEPYPMPFFLVR